MTEKKIPSPLLLVKPGTISRKDIMRAERLGFVCIVECSDPDLARFVEPPITADIDEQARASLELMRYLVYQTNAQTLNRSDLVRFFVKALMDGHKPPNAAPVKTVTKT